MAEINGLPLATSPPIYHTFINQSPERTFAPLYNIQFSLHIGDIHQDKELYFYQTLKPIKKFLTKHTYGNMASFVGQKQCRLRSVVSKLFESLYMIVKQNVDCSCRALNWHVMLQTYHDIKTKL